MIRIQKTLKVCNNFRLKIIKDYSLTPELLNADAYFASLLRGWVWWVNVLLGWVGLGRVC